MRIIKSLTIGAVIALTSVCTQAKDINLKQISSDAGWVFHVNNEKLTNSQLGEFLINTYLPQKKQAKIDEFKARFGENALDNISGVTAYGNVSDDKGIVFIINAKYDKDFLYNKASESEDFETSTYQKYELFKYSKLAPVNPRFNSKKKKPWICYYDDETILISGSVKKLTSAIDVLDGKEPNMADDVNSTIKNELENKSIVLAALNIKSDLIKKKPRAITLKNVERVFFSGDEIDDNINLQVKFDAKSIEAAKAMKMMIDGIKGYIQMNLHNLPEDKLENITNLLDAMAINQNEDKVIVKVTVPVDKIIDKLKNKLSEF